MAPPTSPRASRRKAALGLFLLSLATGAWSLATHRQLEGLGGMVDEWFLVGLNLRVHGTLGIEAGRPDVVLAPGYPIFAAGVAALSPAPEAVTASYLGRSMGLLFVAQAVLLAASSAALFLWLSPRFGTAAALAAGAILGTNPYTVALVGLLHYDVLHIAFLVVGSWALQEAYDRREASSWLFGVAGLVWGAATLVRPVTLILPFFVGGGLLLVDRGRPRRVLRGASAFVLGMTLVVAPLTIRNHSLTGRWVPVNAEGWMALWGSTVRELGLHPNHYSWGELYADDFLPIFRRVTGETAYSRHAFIEHTLALDDAFREAALANIRERPRVYATNCLRSFAAFNLGLNSVLVRVFQHLQRTPVWPSQDWFAVGHSQDFLPRPVGTGIDLFFGLLTFLAGWGVVAAAIRGDPGVLAAAVVYACICAAHSLVYMDLMYYYAKVPFLLAFAAAALARLPKREGNWAATGLASLSLLLTTATLA